MERQRVLIGTVATILLVVATGLTYAQGPGPVGGVDGEATLGHGFTYQGRLSDTDRPVEGTCDLTFKLYDAAGSGSPPSGGTLLGTEEKPEQAISDGYLTVQLDFGSAVFTGEARWLEIDVDCGDGSITLSPRQALTAEPYAVYALGAAWSGLRGVPPGFADGVDDVGTAGAHDHWGEAWGGSGVGLTLSSGNEDALRLYGGDDGLQVESAMDEGVFVKSAGEDGVPVDSPGRDGVSVVEPGSDGFYVRDAGDDGLGVASAADNGVQIDSAGSDGVRVDSAGRYGVYAEGTERGVYGKGVSKGVYGESSSGQGVYGIALYEGSICPLPPMLPPSGGYFVNEGKCGMGVYGEGRTGVLGAATSGSGVRGVATTGMGVHGSSSDGGYGVKGEVTSGGYGVCGVAVGSGGTEAHYGGYFDGQGNYGSGVLAKAGRFGYAADLYGPVMIRARSGSPAVELGEGLDYAEGFDVSGENQVGPGTVLVIDPENPGKLEMSTQPYDTKVAGIVAGAQGEGSGIRLGAHRFDYDVALAGRVYCNVDAADAGIAPGDLLTTSDIPGYAMKATDYARAQGAILGKAMQGLGQGERAQILVLVTLQ
jgi:hypothetical protein